MTSLKLARRYLAALPSMSLMPTAPFFSIAARAIVRRRELQLDRAAAATSETRWLSRKFKSVAAAFTYRKPLTIRRDANDIFVGMTGTEHVNWGQPFHRHRICHGIVV